MVETRSPGNVVARVAANTFTREQISSRYSQISGRSAHDSEQARLNLLISEALYAAALERAGITVSDEEVERDPQFQNVTDDVVITITNRTRNWMIAALAVCDGASTESAYIAHLREPDDDRNKWLEAFERFVLMVDTRAAVVKSLERITPDRVREGLADAVRKRLSREHVTDYILRTAKDSGTTTEHFAEQFWDRIYYETGAEVVDPEYRLMSWREL